MPGIIVVIVIGIMVMNHYSVPVITSMIAPMITMIVIIMIVMINANGHYSKSPEIRRRIGIGIRGIIGHIYR